MIYCFPAQGILHIPQKKMAQIFVETGACTEWTCFGMKNRKCHVSVAEQFLLLGLGQQGKALLSKNDS